MQSKLFSSKTTYHLLDSLLTLPTTNSEGEAISVQRRHYEKIDEGASGHCRGGVQMVFSEVEESLGKVCAPPTGIF